MADESHRARCLVCVEQTHEVDAEVTLEPHDVKISTVEHLGIVKIERFKGQLTPSFNLLLVHIKKYWHNNHIAVG